jgi:hypothetical protein
MYEKIKVSFRYVLASYIQQMIFKNFNEKYGKIGTKK